MWTLLSAFCGASAAQPATFELSKVADTITPFATFQSHNQKIVENAYGIFMVYSYSQTPSPLGTWRLARSIDRGKSWGTIYRSFVPSTPPTLDTDEDGSLFLIHSDFTAPSTQGNATFYRFDPENGFRTPTVSTAIVNGSAGKYTSYYDGTRKRLWYATFWDCELPMACENPTLFALDRDGKVMLRKGLTLPGRTSRLQYPQLEMSGSTLYFAWTTAGHTRNSDDTPRYPSILYVLSEDGGSTWKSSVTSTPLAVPFIGDHTGPGTRVVLDDEVSHDPLEDDRGTWLANFIHKGGYLHFAYYAEKAQRQHYMRFSPRTGARDIDRQPVWQGDAYTLQTRAAGFFSTEPAAATPLFMSGEMRDSNGTRVAILRSSNLGRTWKDHAISSSAVPDPSDLYALSGNRRLTRSGHILGHFTQDTFEPVDSVWFYRAPAVDRSADPYKDWVFFPVITSSAQHDGGFAYTVPLDVRHGGDSPQNESYSKLRLFEKGVELGVAHTPHATIRSTGGGRFSHWNTTLHFSASDNTDPRMNGRRYEVAIPATEVSGPVLYGRIDPSAMVPERDNAYTVTQDFGTVADSLDAEAVSRLRLYEDGVLLGPPHTAHATIRSTGLGHYSHWSGTLYFASSDNTDPRTNGRSYTWSIEGSGQLSCATLHVENAMPEIGHAYTLQRDFGLQTDSIADPSASPIRLFENGVELGAAHSVHQDIRTLGAGRFSDWDTGVIYFSSSDNSDPRSNGRIYTWGTTTSCPP